MLNCILTANDCYKTGRTITPKGVMIHSTGANNPLVARYVQPLEGNGDYKALTAALGYNKNQNDWNRGGLNVCVHGFVGKLADGSVAAVQTLPWNHRGWHAGTGTSGGSANNTHISFEICEDDLTNGDYFAQAYQTAVELTAMLCKKYGLNPLADGVVICHAEGYARGVASNHADVNHWFPKFGKSMDDFRSDVAQAMEGQGGGEAAPETAPASYKVRVIAKDGLNCRTAPSTANPVVTAYPYGTVLTVTKEQSGWGYVGQGWVSLEFVERVNNTAPASYQVRVTAKDGLNCRSGPGTGNKVVKAYVYGATLTISREQSGWGYTGEGWVSLEFVDKV